jgi:hypothetical protein
LGPVAKNLGRPIGRSIIQDEELEVAECLGEDALDALGQVRLTVANWHHDAN